VIGSQPTVLVDTKNILLKDVINIQVVNMVYNEIGQSLVLLLFLNALGTVLIFSQNWAIIFFCLGLLQTISIALKYNLLEDIGKEQKKLFSLLTLGLVLLSSIVVIVFTYMYSAANPSFWWIASSSGLISIFIIVIITRININQKENASLLIITSRRGTHSIALKQDDVKDARQLIWKSRKDITKLSSYTDTHIDEEQFVQ